LTRLRNDTTIHKRRNGLGYFWGVLLDIQWSFNWGLGWKWKRPCFRTFVCVYMRLAICESLGGGGSLSFPINGGCFCANVMLWWCFCLCSSRLARLLTLEDGWVSGVCWMLMLMGMMIVWWGWWWQWWRLGGGVLFRSLPYACHSC
jgi:hypothetical protein